MGETKAKAAGRVTRPKRRPGRPPSIGPKKEQIFTGLLPDIVDRVDAVARREGTSRSAMLAIFIEESLKAWEKSK